jgi:hypothetical protein
MVMQGKPHAQEEVSRISSAIGIRAITHRRRRSSPHSRSCPQAAKVTALSADGFRETLNLSYRYENRWKMFDLGTVHPVDP